MSVVRQRILANPTTLKLSFDEKPGAEIKNAPIAQNAIATRQAQILAGLVLLFLSNVVLAQPDFPNNSTQKMRATLGQQASRIGSAVNWQQDLESALALSQETGKSVIWYVPTLQGTFMDRKDSIDRYMLAGPFSWPAFVGAINENLIPVKGVPSLSQQKKYNLRPYVFVEPGILILDPLGNVTAKHDRLTTLHPDWFQSLLEGAVESNPTPPAKISARPESLERNWDLFRQGRYWEIEMAVPDPASETATEELLLAGMVAFRMGDHDAAQSNWARASQAQPDHPLAWKAAAEAEGVGPFVRGFEVHRELPEKILPPADKSAGTTAPQGTFSEDALWERGSDFLLGMQNQDGGFTDCDYDFGGTDSLPNVHVAVTSLAAMALMESRARLQTQNLDLSDPAGSPNQRRASRIDRAIVRAAEFVLNDQNINRADRDELVWALAYRTRLMARLANLHLEFKQSLQVAVEELEEMQTESGNWFHEYTNPFVTATALTALKEAATAGATIDQPVIQRGLAALNVGRFGNGAYPYRAGNVQGQQGTGQHLAASAGRMPVCELGLWSWGQSSDEGLANAVDRSFRFNQHLISALKYDDHTSNLNYGGFFFWYDMRGRSEAISHLRDETLRRQHNVTQRELILSLPEIDGCFVDSHELGRVYGTAMALLSLPKVE